MISHDLLLTGATRLIHIGPHKTGTTAIQSAFHSARGSLHRFGVSYAGRGEQPLLAALAVAGGKGMLGQRQPRPEDWTDLVDEVRAAGKRRVVVSSEFFCYADDQAARRVVTDLTGGPVHVAVTLRPLHKIAPSQWQQYVQNGLRTPYQQWLEGMFARPPYDRPTPSFWRRHRHGELVRRWAQAAGADKLTVIVADETNPDMLIHTFEALVGLPEGSLAPTQNAENRSLTLGETELVRRLNEQFAEQGWSEAAHAQFVRRGAARQMKTHRRPAPDEPRLAMPAWALERAAEIGAQAAETISSLGVRIVGDISTLAAVPDEKSAADDIDAVGEPPLPAAAAAQAVLGAITASGLVDSPSSTEQRLVSSLSAQQLLRVVAGRGLARLRHRLHARPGLTAWIPRARRPTADAARQEERDTS